MTTTPATKIEVEEATDHRRGGGARPSPCRSYDGKAGAGIQSGHMRASQKRQRRGGLIRWRGWTDLTVWAPATPPPQPFPAPPIGPAAQPCMLQTVSRPLGGQRQVSLSTELGACWHHGLCGVLWNFSLLKTGHALASPNSSSQGQQVLEFWTPTLHTCIINTPMARSTDVTCRGKQRVENAASLHLAVCQEWCYIPTPFVRFVHPMGRWARQIGVYMAKYIQMDAQPPKCSSTLALSRFHWGLTPTGQGSRGENTKTTSPSTPFPPS